MYEGVDQSFKDQAEIESADLSGVSISIKSRNCTKGNIAIPTVSYAFIEAKEGPIKNLFKKFKQFIIL